MDNWSNRATLNCDAFRACKFEHTIFAIPFAYLGTILAAGGMPSLYVG